MKNGNVQELSENDGNIQELPEDTIERIRCIVRDLISPGGKSSYGYLNVKGRRQIRRTLKLLDELEANYK
jgi:hypothetical protein